MTLTTRSVRAAADAVCARDGIDVEGLSRQELVALSNDLATLRRSVDVALAQVASEMDRRSSPDDGAAGLAARAGFRSAGQMIAHVTGGSLADARRLMVTGNLMAESESVLRASDSPADAPTDAGAGVPTDAGAGVPTDAGADVPTDASGDGPGEPPSPLAQVRAQVARSVRDGHLSVDAAAAFGAAIANVPDTEDARELLLRALAKAPGLALHEVRKLVWRAQAFADPRAWEQREERQYTERYASLRDDADGMVTLTARLTPLDAAPVRAVLDANVRRAMQRRREDPSSDTRTAWQMRADILVDLCKHALDCDQPTSGVKTTVVVRLTRAELESGLGVGEIDGGSQPVSAGALRRAAADAEVIPAVLGGESEVLDWGRERRLFSPAQRLALVERDGGCAWCNAPPSWCEAHHIRWWERDAGPTDLHNGVLLCTRCHHRIHRDGWEIEVRQSAGGRDGGAAASHRSGEVWFTPPRSVDPSRTARPGGRDRYDVAA